MELRRRTKPTSIWERASFVIMWTGGMSLRAIARQTGSSVTTVYRWIRRWQNEGHINTRTRIYRSFEYYPQDFVFRTEGFDNIHKHIASHTRSSILKKAYSSNKKLEALQKCTSVKLGGSLTPQLTYEYSRYMALHSNQGVDDIRTM